MIRIIRDFFSAPVFPEDEEKNNTARVLNVLIMNMLVVIPLVGLAIIFVFVQKTGSAIILFSTLTLALVSRMYMRRGKVRFASILYVTGLWLLATTAVVLTGRITTSMTSLHIALAIIAGILLGRRSAFLFAVLSSIVGLVLAVLENGGYPLIHYLPVPPLPSWFVWVLALHWTITPLYLTLQSSEEALERSRESRKRFATLFNEAPMSYVIVHNVDGVPVIKDCNAAFYNELGYTREQVVGQPMENFYSESSRSEFLDQGGFQKVLENEETIQIERELVSKDGRIINTLIRVAPEFDKNGEAIGVLAMGLDITERIKTEELLKRSEEKYRSIAETTAEWIWEIDLNGKHTFSNPGIQSILGYHPDEIIGQSVSLLLYEEDRKEVNKRLNQLISEKHGWREWTLRWRHKDGSYRILESNANPIVDPNGKVHGFRGTDRDITDRIKAESTRQALIEIMHEALVAEDLHSLIEAIHQSLSKVIFAENFFILLFNKETGLFEEAYCVDKFDPPGMPPSAYKKSMSAYVQETGEPLLFTEEGFEELAKRGVLELVGADSPSWLGVPLKVAGETIGVMVVQDYDTPNRYQEEDVELFASVAGQIALVVESKRAEEALRESEERFKNLSAMTSEGIMVHDNGIILIANKAFANLGGYSNPDDLIGKNGLEALPFASDSRERLQDSMRSGSTEKIEIELFKADGSTIQAETYGKEITYQGRKARLVSMRDISERKKAEEALRRSEETFAKAFQASPIILVISSIKTGQIIEVNETFEKVTGYTRQEVISGLVKDSDFFVNKQDSNRLEELLIKNGRVRDEELKFRMRNGDVITSNYSAETINLGGEVYTLGVIENITDRKRAEEHIQSQLERLSALHNIDIAVKSSFDLQTIFEVFLGEVTSKLKVDAASILLFNRGTYTLENAFSIGFHSDALKYSSLEVGEGYAGQIIQDKKTIVIPDLSQEDNRLTEALSKAGENFAVYIGSPLIAKSKVVGVLEIFQRESFEPSLEWLDFLDILSSQAAIAIDSTQLFENLQRANFDLSLAYDATIEGWSRALDQRDQETEGHTQHLANITMKLAMKLGVADDEIVHIRRGALLHDIGKMGIPDAILLKPDELTEGEWEIMRQHPTLAHEMLAPIQYLRPALDIPLYHHEKWDGTGYPYNLKGDAIPLAARIFAVVDVWDALLSKRPYRSAWLEKEVIKHIKSLSGTHFEPRIVDVFLDSLGDVEELKNR